MPGLNHLALLCVLLLHTTASAADALPRLPPGVKYGSEYYKPAEGRTSQLGADHWVSNMFANDEHADKVRVVNVVHDWVG